MLPPPGETTDNGSADKVRQQGQLPVPSETSSIFNPPGMEADNIVPQLNEARVTCSSCLHSTRS